MDTFLVVVHFGVREWVGMMSVMMARPRDGMNKLEAPSTTEKDKQRIG